MEQFLKNLFLACGFEVDDSSKSVSFFGRSDAERTEYYLTVFVEKSDLTRIESRLDEVNELFQKKKKEARDIEKNTSLIICVEFDSYSQDSPQYKNRLLQIEEDEFFYRKYIIPYTKLALESLSDSSEILKSINDVVSSEERFERFNADMLRDETYFFAMQLFIKLPFLNLNIDRGESLVSISELLERRIATSEVNYLSALLLSDQVGQNERDLLLQKALDPNDNSFDNFINTFPSDAPIT